LFGGTGSGGFGGTSTTTPAFGSGTTGSFGPTPQNNGTGSVPFQAVEEKDPGQTGNAKNQYQAVTFQDPYKAFSYEELRLTDYAQGRKHGNASGQAGAFGATSGFGGFGQSSTGTSGFGTSNPSGGLFGQSNTSSPFGQQQSSTPGFGNTTNSGLFGAKPASTSLFGSTTTTSAQSGGGLFGTSGGGFGGGTAGFGGGTTGSSLFGPQNQQQNKPAFGGFGGGSTGGFGSTTGGGFGTSTTSSGGGLFGSTTATSSPFGQQQQQPSGTSFGGFGQQNQQQGQTGGSIFGGFGSNTQNQQKPSLFGGSSSTTGTGLFGGQQNQQNTGSGLFGGTSSSGLFGNKPATTNPFGSLGSGTSGSGLFGNNQQQQAGSGSGFGQSTQQSSGGLFGSKPTLGSSIFGPSNTQQQPAGSGLFGSNQQQQQPQTGFGSIFGASQSQPQQQQPQQLNASQIQFPYGAPSLFLDVQSPTQSPGPIATPLSTSQKTKKQAIIPAYRINPNASSRLITPQKRPQGYGFAYSTYGTPGSAMGSSPSGMGNSLLGSSIGRSLGKSYSSSNLRNSYTAQDSLLVPGAFAGSTRSGTGSMKKLNINRNLNTRRSLFEGELSDEYPGQSGLRKQVSFDSSTKQLNGTSKENGLNPVNGALVRTSSPERISPTVSTTRLNGQSEMEQVKQVNGTTGKELAVIAEDGSPPVAISKVTLTDAEKARLTQKDQKPGDYWMQPDLSELKKLSRSQLANIKNFQVGRKGVGEIHFGDVDLSQVPLDKIIGDIVKLDVRRATVYGDDTTVPKPSVGSGLNVPSEITLENSWPRASGGRLPVFEKHGERFNKHIRRLKRVEGTEYVNYDDKSGCWTFRVPHYTTYGLDYDDDDDESMLSTSVLSEAAPPTPSPLKAPVEAATNDAQQKSPEDSIMSPPASSPDDTFEFKKGRRNNLPGQFDEQEMDVFDNHPIVDAEDDIGTPQSFLGDRSAGSSATEDDDQTMTVIPQNEEFELEAGKDMAGSFPAQASTAEHDGAAFNTTFRQSKPKSILKTRDIDGTPFKAARIDVDDWAEQLQRTVSPVKKDRQALRDIQAMGVMDHEQPAILSTASVHGAGFATSIDLMHSIFGKSTTKTGEQNANGMELRSGKRVRTEEQSENAEFAFHQSVKPRFSENDVLVYVVPGGAQRMEDGLFVNSKESIVAESQDIRFAHYAIQSDPVPPTIAIQQETSQLEFDAEKIPLTTTMADFKFSEFGDAVAPTSPARTYERQAWNLAGILFDRTTAHEQDRLSRLKEFWSHLCKRDAEKQLPQAVTTEEKAFIHLSCGDVINACAALLDDGNVHLATLVAQLPGNEGFRRLMKEQLDTWRTLNTLSEFDNSIRAIYELLAGNVCMSEGLKNTTAENRVADLHFSQHFKLTWRQVFALHLFYGIELESGIQDAVRSYATYLKDGRETVQPRPWFVEQHINTGWSDPHIDEREDLFWGLLKLFVTFTVDEHFASISDITAPENVSGNPIEARFSFQLFHLLRVYQANVSELRSRIKRQSKKPNAKFSQESKETADQLIRTYAASLQQNASSNKEALKTAVWVLTHLSDSNERALSIKRLLNLNAAQLNPHDEPLAIVIPGEPEPRMLVPKEWECAAKALYARAVEHDPISEARWLINAGDLAEAHGVVCEVIGPNALIEQDYDQLREVLGSLVEDGARRQQISSAAWERGGNLYHSYIELIDLETMHSQNRAKKRTELQTVVQRIAKTLTGINKEDGLKTMAFRQRIAMQMMAQHILNVLDKEKVPFSEYRNRRIGSCDLADNVSQMKDKSMALRLPLAQDMQLHVSRQLAMDYYKAAIAAGI